MALASALLILALADPGVIRADVKAGGQTLFTLEKIHTPGQGGRETWKSIYRDLKGAEVLTLESEIYDHRPTKVVVVHSQVDLRAEITIKPGKVIFEVREKSGEVERTEEDVMGVVMVGPGLTAYLQSDDAWPRLLRGEPVPMKIAAWVRRSTFSFEMVPDAARSTDEHLVVKMRPTSFVVRAFVSDMTYTFDRASRRLLEYVGPVAVKRVGSDGALSDLTAAVVYR